MNKILVYGGLFVTVLASTMLLIFVFGIIQDVNTQHSKIYSQLVLPVFLCAGLMYWQGSSFTKKGLNDISSKESET